MLYEASLGILILVNAGLFARQHRSEPGWSKDVEAEKGVEERNAASKKRDFMVTYLVAYLLATAADWLQGPHIYAIYRYDKGLEERTTAALYASGFVSGAISSTFVGQLTDKHGRRTACLVFCLSYVICCATMLSDDLIFLFVGRVFGGIGTTLLFTSFETWMMTEYHKRGLEASGLSTSTIFGRQTTLNSVVAIVSGIVGEALVNATGSRKAPFMLAGLVSALCAGWLATRWNENYGRNEAVQAEQSSNEFWTTVKAIFEDAHITALTAASCAFESMMYLFVFFWTSAITSSRATAGSTGDPPYGLIFACFMCAMMAGSQVFSSNTSYDVTSASFVLENAVTLASLALMSSAIIRQESTVFWAFCLVEFCVGLYFPSISFLKGRLIKDESRAKLYSLMRVPINACVLTAHGFAAEGDSHRNRVFLIFGTGLLIAFVVVRRSIV